MTISAEDKKQIITDFAAKNGDTGSSTIQVAILTKRISNLTSHFKEHAKDNHSRQGLLRMVSKRRKLLDYIKSNSYDDYAALIKRLGLRR